MINIKEIIEVFKILDNELSRDNIGTIRIDSILWGMGDIAGCNITIHCPLEALPIEKLGNLSFDGLDTTIEYKQYETIITIERKLR